MEASPSGIPKAPSPPPNQMPSKERRMSHFKEYKFFRSFSAKIENWPMRKAEQLWRKMRERKIAGHEANGTLKVIFLPPPMDICKAGIPRVGGLYGLLLKARSRNGLQIPVAGFIKLWCAA
ncbi:unnamed protein product [Pieris macdunnoughi]|uniref:Uncharacterized protein n=1 Tax=Pieris macdunnoughi TaxID=345717 RepID=A0A821RHM8_9NEOP|nr:unnamed protein product [Pieris macdunnoughi]